MRIITGQRHDQRRNGFRQPVAVKRVFDNQDRCDTVNRGGGLSRVLGLGTRGQDGHVAERFAARNGLGGGIHRQFAVIDFSK